MFTTGFKLWLDALRSGQFIKIVGRLGKKGCGYCALGVACEIAVDHGITNRFVSPSGEISYGLDEKSKNAGHLPPEVMKWLGVKDQSASFTWGGSSTLTQGHKSVPALNDDTMANRSFTEIADTLEAAAMKNDRSQLLAVVPA